MKQKVVVVGGTNTDLAGESFSPIVGGDSNIGKVTFSPGGVGHNIALNLSLMGEDVTFITALGGDVFGSVLRKTSPLNSIFPTRFLPITVVISTCMLQIVTEICTLR